MWPNLQQTADLVTFTEEIFNGKLHFLCSAGSRIPSEFFKNTVFIDYNHAIASVCSQQTTPAKVFFHPFVKHTVDYFHNFKFTLQELIILQEVLRRIELCPVIYM